MLVFQSRISAWWESGSTGCRVLAGVMRVPVSVSHWSRYTLAHDITFTVDCKKESC